MSRCFPYPPPGYALSRVSKDALIESIKLQNDKAKSKEQRKEEKRREKKEKRKKEKKDKVKHKHDKSNLVPNQFGEKLLPVTELAEPQQQFEGSSVTEEYGKPVCLLAPSTSSDSTENSKKRKRLSSPVEATLSNGKIIRIKLPVKKPSQLSVSTNEQQQQQTCSTSQVEDVTISKNERDCSTSQPIETPIARKTANPPEPSEVVMTPMQKLELQYINLMDSLVPCQQQDSFIDEADDLDWLLKSKNRKSCAEKKNVSGNEVVLGYGSSGLWPRAQYLKDVEVYALPYTIPY
ncbi:hypothetical protein STAS_02283 [Striga asiatica]|uniref:Uncharacterized protein n=1 Tax=Striga asiatica TaxID=4170 RepID=A0A5A7P1M7_STRAF|nr:hypothetical protein STAS_02283 [Striga asiatica]